VAELWQLTGAEAARRIAAGEITSEALVQSCLDRIAERDQDVEAWEWLDPGLALGQAREADRARPAGNLAPLHGVPVAIKDIIETEDMPTQNGYTPHFRRETGRDAFCVSQLRDAGAVIMGKTITTELAARHPGETMNPHNPAHTPGGSSSGSAAAVADGQVPLALGTQTGGSVIRPASFCGTWALKPTFGLIGRTGVTLQADWLDTVGVFGRSAEDLALCAEVMTARDPGDPQAERRFRTPLRAIAMQEPEHRPRLAFMRGAMWDRAEPAARAALEDFVTSLGALCDDWPSEFTEWPAEVWENQRILQLYGNARHYGPLMDAHGDAMSASLRESIEEGRQISEAAYSKAVGSRRRLYNVACDLASDDVDYDFFNVLDAYDAIICLASAGPAPEGLGWTGDPVFNAIWTYFGTPCVNVPLLWVNGLPMGVQLVGRPGSDGELLRTARWLEREVTTGHG